MDRAGRRLDRAGPGLRPGDHLCWAFADDAAFTAVAVECVAEGLEAGERVVFSRDAETCRDLEDRLAPLDVERHLAAGALLVVPLRDLYGSRPVIDPRAQAAGYRSLVAQAAADGYRALRAVVDATALVVEPAARRHFVAYELVVDRMINDLAMSAMCGYDSRLVGEEGIAELSAVHPRRNAAASGVGFCLAAQGRSFALDGQIDVANGSVLLTTLEGAQFVDGDTVDVDVASLEFIDVAGMRSLAGWASSLVRQGRTVRLHNARPILRRAWALAGFEGVQWN